MTLHLKTTLPWSDYNQALELIFSSDAAMRPTHVSDDEDGKRVLIAESDDRNRLLGVAGGFFWAPECCYDIGISPSKSVTIFALSSNASGLSKLLEILCELEIGFGYVCAAEERTHRNRVERKMQYGMHEAWIGRDSSRYLPGVYWLTAVPVTLQQKLGVPIDSVNEIALRLQLIANRNWLIQLYVTPEEWEKHSNRIDQWCDRTPGVFSKRPAIEALAKARSFMEASDALEGWR